MDKVTQKRLITNDLYDLIIDAKYDIFDIEMLRNILERPLASIYSTAHKRESLNKGE